jgi:signal transduction histidine kinase
MPQVDGHTLDAALWRQALEKYAGAAHLTVILCRADGEEVCGPINPTTLFELFAQSRDDHRLFAECKQRCLGETQNRTPVVASNRPGFAVVGTSLVLNGQIVGAAVAGYELVQFPEHLAMERFARDVGIAFPRLWETARREAPVSRQRLLFQGELLQVLRDTLLMESYRTRRQEKLSDQLRTANVAKDRFLAVMSHELRTPLTAVLGWVQLLRTGQLTETARERAMASIERNAQSQIGLIEDRPGWPDSGHRTDRGRKLGGPHAGPFGRISAASREAREHFAGDWRNRLAGSADFAIRSSAVQPRVAFVPSLLHRAGARRPTARQADESRPP